MAFLVALAILAALWLIGTRTDLLIREHATREPHHGKLWYWFCTQWKKLEVYAHAHHKRFHQAHGIVHASYFTMVFTHGPYNLGAGLMLALIVIGWLLHLEDR